MKWMVFSHTHSLKSLLHNFRWDISITRFWSTEAAQFHIVLCFRSNWGHTAGFQVIQNHAHRLTEDRHFRLRPSVPDVTSIKFSVLSIWDLEHPYIYSRHYSISFPFFFYTFKRSLQGKKLDGSHFGPSPLYTICLWWGAPHPIELQRVRAFSSWSMVCRNISLHNSLII